ncbi:sulfurtransferase complex subunit TusB [uncultured Paraglaciecola sp.]|uniref:sulfurtransferase complex subunit TusB n=1 Tax=uncultured Paraglaciecola sp. TaxID=1765024 RepID=UPI002608E122|nr:sulfurtransferase complex subunit TusB [uncultured Paraglaciecola sp.]
MILHKVSTSPFADNGISQCLGRIQPTDKLLLTQDAVYAMQNSDITDALQSLGQIYLLEDDTQARGLTIKNNLFKAISYAEFVDLTLECKQVISW